MGKETAPLSNNQKKPRLYYGYTVLIACFVIMVLVYGSQNSFGVFFKPMINEFGWSRAGTSGPISLYMIISGVLSIVAGRLSDRFGPRKVVTIGGIILGLGYILTSTIHSLWELYLYYGFLVAAGSSAMYVPLVSMVARWFTKRRGLMSGIGISGIGFGIGIVPIIASQIIESVNWRISLLAVGSASLVLIVILAQFLKSRPAAEVSTDSLQPKNSGAISEDSGFSFRDAARTGQFWMIFIAWVFYGFFFQVGIVHIVPHATDIGMAAVTAATVLTVIGMVGTGGRVLIGLGGDRFSNRTIIYISYALTAVGFLGLAFSNTYGMIYIFAVIYGALSGIGILLIPVIAERYGFKDLGTLSGTIVFANCLGGAFGPPLAGAIFDSFNSYRWAFIICGILGIAAAVIIWRLRPANESQKLKLKV